MKREIEMNDVRHKIKKAARIFAVAAISTGLSVGSASAQAAPASSGALASAATNPVSNLMQFQLQFQNQSGFRGPASGSSQAYIVQPVIPIKLPWAKVPLVITRTTLPYVRTQNLPGIGHGHGFGDLAFLALFTPNFGLKGQTIGFGPNISLPTAGDNGLTGSGKYEIGPAAIYINTKTKTQWGMFAYHNEAIASTSSGSGRTNTSKTSIQPILTHHFGEGWFVGSPDVPQVYDWKNSEWTLAVGPQIGRVTKLGKFPVKMFTGAYYNPAKNEGSAKWKFKLGLTFLFPE